MTGRLNSTHVLLCGFATIVLLLIYAAMQAASLQSAGWEQQATAYQRYVRMDDAITALRRSVWLGGGYARDLLLDGSPSAGARFRDQINELRADSARQTKILRELAPDRLEKLEVDETMNVFLKELDQLASRSIPRQQAAMAIVQEIVVPRRNSTFGVLEELRKSTREDLQAAQSTLQSERRIAARKLTFLLGAAILIGILVAWVSLRFAARWERERQKHFQEIATANEQLEDLSERLLEIQEQERRALSRELHDEVGQTLTALRMELSQALGRSGEPDVRERLERARKLAEKTVREVRDISLMLRPALLDDLGLGPALQWQLEDFSKRSGIPCEFSGVDVGEELPDVLKTCVFRVAQEALNNCEKYSGAGRVRVTLGLEGDSLKLEVSDDGSGFELDPRGMPRRGTGIFGMKERVQKLGGLLTVDTAVGRGTRLRLTLPASVLNQKELVT